MPTYHFAHLVDDVLMGTTHVIRDLNWLPSTPLHIQLFNAYGTHPPKYAHISPVNKREGNSVRKLSKRKDPEAAVSYYHEMGIPVEAVKIYIATIVNSNFEAWYNCNKDKSIYDFHFSFDKISKSGPLFDIEKLNNISREILANMKATDVYEKLLLWAQEFDIEYASLITKYRDYTISVLNIEREQKKPRKDFKCFSEIKSLTWYMYDELFITNTQNYDWQLIKDIKEINQILEDYIENYYNEKDDKETWFEKMKRLCENKGYSANVKDYKDNPNKYKGSIADISMVLRVALTTKSTTPDLYEIMKLLGTERIKNRFDRIKNQI